MQAGTHYSVAVLLIFFPAHKVLLRRFFRRLVYCTGIQNAFSNSGGINIYLFQGVQKFHMNSMDF